MLVSDTQHSSPVSWPVFAAVHDKFGPEKLRLKMIASVCVESKLFALTGRRC